MGRTHGLIVMRIFALLYFGSEASIHLNEFQVFNCMIQLGRGVRV